MRKPLRRHADDLVRLEAPVDEGADPPAPITSATVTARIYDREKDTEISNDETSGTTTIRVSSARRFETGDVVRIEQNDSVFVEATVGSLDAAAGTIAISPGLSANADAGSRIARKLGADVICLPYNSANANVETFDWGFSGEVAHNHADLRRGQRVRVEITLDDGAGRVSLESFETSVV